MKATLYGEQVTVIRKSKGLPDLSVIERVNGERQEYVLTSEIQTQATN